VIQGVPVMRVSSAMRAHECTALELRPLLSTRLGKWLRKGISLREKHERPERKPRRS
jgi:hypothetical protein